MQLWLPYLLNIFTEKSSSLPTVISLAEKVFESDTKAIQSIWKLETNWEDTSLEQQHLSKGWPNPVS
jgi:hypothetical protein